MARTRWPAWVYQTGDEPDYRFSFANERTFLAWIRTALALIAGGVAIDVIDLNFSAGVQKLLACVLLLLGITCALLAFLRWATAERAIRRGEPLPAVRMTVVVAALVAVVGATIVVTLL